MRRVEIDTLILVDKADLPLAIVDKVDLSVGS